MFVVSIRLVCAICNMQGTLREGPLSVCSSSPCIADSWPFYCPIYRFFFLSRHVLFVSTVRFTVPYRVELVPHNKHVGRATLLMAWMLWRFGGVVRVKRGPLASCSKLTCHLQAFLQAELFCCLQSKLTCRLVAFASRANLSFAKANLELASLCKLS